MSRPSLHRDSPLFTATNMNILPTHVLSESPTSTSMSTPAVGPTPAISLDDDDAVPPLHLDDIQSVLPFPDAPEGNEISATIALPQDNGSGQVPSVTITTSHQHSMETPTPKSTPPLHTSTMREFISNIVPFPQSGPDPAPSTASSALTEGDKLSELPASFSTPRLQALARKAAESSGIPSQDSISASMIGQTSRRSFESERSFSGTLPARTRGDSTPKRVSFEGDRQSFSSSVQNVRNAFRPSSPPDGRANDVPLSPHNQKSHSSPARSPSPLRNFLWPLHRSHSREEPFVPVDPYKLNVFSLPVTLRHVLSQIIRQLYRHILLRLPSIYFTRVSRVFENAEVSRPEVQRMIEGRNKGDAFRWPADHEWVAPNVSPALIRFKESWETFVESVLKEWKTLNVVSALLLTCVVLLPIYGRSKPEIEGASTAPVIRTTAFLSLICALMSLVYGCVYILRFATMKSMYRASRWAEEAQRDTFILWNVWVLLAMPAVWISWSMIFFCICILDFVWDQPFSSPSSHDFESASRTPHHPPTLEISLSESDRMALAPRIVISCVFVLGIVYFALVVRTFRHWGDPRSSLHMSSMEAGRWTPRTPSPVRGAPASPRPSRESRFSKRNGMEISDDRDDEKAAMKQMYKERRTRSVDSAMV